MRHVETTEKNCCPIERPSRVTLPLSRAAPKKCFWGDFWGDPDQSLRFSPSGTWA